MFTHHRTELLWQLTASWERRAKAAKTPETADIYRDVAGQLRSRIRMLEQDSQQQQEILNHLIVYLTQLSADGSVDRFALTPTHVTLWHSREAVDRAATLIHSLRQATQPPDAKTRTLLALLDSIRSNTDREFPAIHPIDTPREDTPHSESSGSDSYLEFEDFDTDSDPRPKPP